MWTFPLNRCLMLERDLRNFKINKLILKIKAFMLVQRFVVN